MRVIITGCAGFIGMHVAQALLARGEAILGLDNLDAYYDPRLKEARLARLSGQAGFSFGRVDLTDTAATLAAFNGFKPQRVVHLAAQAGVRYSLKNPHAYAQSNLVGFVNILEACRAGEVEHLVYASTSSVYGANTRMPFSEHDPTDHPVSLYAATKRANELMAHTYSHLYRLPATGLRFFTVYGPWGRPDMSPMLFASAILDGRPIEVFNEGRMQRDFTYIDDITAGVVGALDRVATPDPAFDPAQPDPATSYAPFRIYNIGNHEPVDLLRYIGCIEQALGRKAILNLMPMQPGDVVATYADIGELQRAVGFRPTTPIEVGVQRFVTWFTNWRERGTLGC